MLDDWEELINSINDSDVPNDINNLTNKTKQEKNKQEKNKINDKPDPRYIASNLEDLNLSFDKPNNFKFINNNVNCDSCNGTISKYKNLYACNDCGLEMDNITLGTDDSYSVSATTECNVNSDGFMNIKFIGRGSYGNNRSLYKSCADYKKYRKNHTFKDMKNLNIQSDKLHIPNFVSKDAIEMFGKVKEANVVLRTNGHKGILSACVYYACYNNGISKTPTELAKHFGIEEKFHSKGIRVLKDLNEKGLLKLPENVSTIRDYVERNLTLINIPYVSNQGINYRDFVIEIILKAEEKKLHIINDCKNTTKAAGTIYLLTRRISEYNSISKELLDKEWEISKTTYIRYYKMILRYHKLFKPIFKRHRIPMPKTWKKITSVVK